jgi:hypothetical protein
VRRYTQGAEADETPGVPPAKGKTAAIAQDAASYQRLLDIAAREDASEGVCQGLDDARRGRIRPARKFFDEFEAANGIPG